MQQPDLGLSVVLDLIQLSMHSRDIEIVTTDHVSPYGVSIAVLVLHTSGELRTMKRLDQDLGGRQGCSAVEMLHSAPPSYRARALYFFSLVALQLFFFKARKCGNWLAGELAQLQDVSCAGALVSPVVSSPANSCASLRDLELQMHFLLCVHKSWELCPGSMAADTREKNLVHLIHENKTQ